MVDETTIKSTNKHGSKMCMCQSMLLAGKSPCETPAPDSSTEYRRVRVSKTKDDETNFMQSSHVHTSEHGVIP